jgi:DNA-binding transcriptional ArsR family regulator
MLPSPDIDDDPGDREPRVVGVDSDDADDVLAALSAGTARSLLTALYDDPATPSELADRADTSLQNAQYHLEKLRDADLVESVGTRYSEKGREMTVYAPTDGPIVLFAGDDDQGEGMREALAGVVGAAALVSAAAVAVQLWLPGDAGGGGGGGGGISTMDTASSGGGEGVSTLPPGVLFAVGGLVALLGVLALVAWRRR